MLFATGITGRFGSYFLQDLIIIHYIESIRCILSTYLMKKMQRLYKNRIFLPKKASDDFGCCLMLFYEEISLKTKKHLTHENRKRWT